MRQSLGDPRPRATQEPRKPSLWAGPTPPRPLFTSPRRSLQPHLDLVPSTSVHPHWTTAHATCHPSNIILRLRSTQSVYASPNPIKPLNSTPAEASLDTHPYITPRLRAASLGTRRPLQNKVWSSPAQRLACMLFPIHTYGNRSLTRGFNPWSAQVAGISSKQEFPRRSSKDALHRGPQTGTTLARGRLVFR